MSLIIDNRKKANPFIAINHLDVLTNVFSFLEASNIHKVLFVCCNNKWQNKIKTAIKITPNLLSIYFSFYLLESIYDQFNEDQFKSKLYRLNISGKEDFKFYAQKITYLKLSQQVLDFVTKTSQMYAKLTSIDLSNNQQLKDCDLSFLGQFTHIVKLDLGNNSSLTDECTKHIINLNKLQELNLTWCYKITNVGFSQIIQNLNELIRLKLTWCTRISNDAIQHMPKLRKLKYLILDDCNQVDNISINHILSIPNLFYLNINNCDKISSNSILKVRNHKSLKHLKI